jgi:hypothetical protein
MKKSLILLIVVAFLLQSCAKIFYTPDAARLAAAQKIIAIVPPKVAIAPRKNIQGDALIEQQKTESVNFQKEMYSWMLKRKMQGAINVEVQDVETTNAILAKTGFNYAKVLTPKEMCNVLGVDGMITSNYSLARPMSEGVAIAVALLGAWGPTHNVTVSLSIHDQSTDKIIWNFDHELSSSFLGSPAGLVGALMRQASRKMPYFTSSKSY